MVFRLAFTIRVVGFVCLMLTGDLAAAQDIGPPPVRLDRAGMHATFSEQFENFAASASGVVDGRPAWRTTYIGSDRTLPNNHEAEWYADPGPDGPFRISKNILEITATPAAGLPRGAAYRR
jgi:hypothetical protein